MFDYFFGDFTYVQIAGLLDNLKPCSLDFFQGKFKYTGSCDLTENFQFDQKPIQISFVFFGTADKIFPQLTDTVVISINGIEHHPHKAISDTFQKRCMLFLGCVFILPLQCTKTCFPILYQMTAAEYILSSVAGNQLHTLLAQGEYRLCSLCRSILNGYRRHTQAVGKNLGKLRCRVHI